MPVLDVRPPSICNRAVGGVLHAYSNVPETAVKAANSGNIGGHLPYCYMAQAQLSFHGHRDAVKFFAAVPCKLHCTLRHTSLFACIHCQLAEITFIRSTLKSRPKNRYDTGEVFLNWLKTPQKLYMAINRNVMMLK